MQRDVTAVIKELVHNDTLQVIASNDLAGDPAADTHKQLRVTYTLDGIARSQTVKEKVQIQIPGLGETPGTLVIIDAVYGVLGHAPERTVWFQSKYLRANLHFRGDEFYLRDLHVYSDRFPQPFLTETVKRHGIEQRLPAVLDGYHWSADDVRSDPNARRAQGRFVLVGADGQQTPLTMAGKPTVSEVGATLTTTVPLVSGGSLQTIFQEREVEFSVSGTQAHSRLGLVFEWVPSLSAFQGVTANRLNYRFRDFDYAVSVFQGIATKTVDGVRVLADGPKGLRLYMAQDS